jgi:hypothetical protein
MKKKNRLTFLSVAAVVGLALITLYFINNKIVPESTDGHSVSSTVEFVSVTSSEIASQTAVAKATVDPNLYENSKYGFSVSLQDGWEGYSAKASSNDPQWAVQKIDFQIKASDGQTYIPMIIYVADASSYSEDLATSVHATKITQSDKYVYLYSTWEQTPNSLIALTDKSIANTIKTFKLK